MAVTGKTMPLPIPVHIISLRRRADRRAWIQEHLQQIGLPFSFFDATDVRDLDHEPLARLYDPVRFSAHNPDHPEMSAGLLACTLSHYRLWQQTATCGIPWTLVLEDDAIFTLKHPLPLLDAVLAAAGPNDVVLLNSRCRGVWLQDRVTLPSPHKLYRVNSETSLAAAYLLSAGAAQRLVASVSREGILCAADWWHRRDGADWSRLIPIRVVKPDPVTQHVEMGSDVVAADIEYFDFVHDHAHRSLTLSSGLVREPLNPRWWPLFFSRWLRRLYGLYRIPPRCLN